MSAVLAPDAPAATARLRVRCRGIRAADGPALVALLARGFPDRMPAYWTQAIDRLLRHAAALAVPDCGTVLDCEGAIVGVLLLIPSADGSDGTATRRCNVSSWFVDPRFAAYGALLVNQALRRKDVTYFNISPAPHTRSTIEAQGFVRYSRGRIVAVPALLPPRRGVRIRLFDPAAPDDGTLPRGVRDRLVRHAGYGCLPLLADTPAGPEAFLVLPWMIRGRLPSAQLIWCRDIAVFVALAGPIGRFLLRRGLPVVTVDACGPVTGLPGLRIADRAPKYARGPAVPATGDLADTELVMFGP